MILLDSPTFRRLGRQLSSRLKFSRGECRTFRCLLANVFEPPHTLKLPLRIHAFASVQLHNIN